ncbi:hypothetical protein CEY09_30305 [Achromobacter marplatensis]|uniref:Uncharacterized protein DUF1833 n=1 Tax=Achromobacter marplatensis TaxID=470868 RepID=A0ABX9FW97_9BURK|nr:DUF1833 family protein [Achromobacter marplatensis]OWT55582.1 hypothetical protein CEY09_30305 [Achromobacter marplatensis]RBP11257.1 uncharacterized protein DUF1833 [Achromobacter marplatensis]CAB3712444.1 hypothetical protein LMG26219_06005 [Achromobacter marplatensis]
MSTLAEVYASAPAGSLIIPSLEIAIAGIVPIRICSGFEDQVLGGELYEAGSLSISLPAKNTTGMQTLNFGVAGVNSTVQFYFDQALESGEAVKITYREFLESDKTQPARRPYVMDLIGGSLQDGEASLSAGFFDVLNLRWPRQLYTAQNAPGIRYL